MTHVNKKYVELGELSFNGSISCLKYKHENLTAGQYVGFCTPRPPREGHDNTETIIMFQKCA